MGTLSDEGYHVEDGNTGQDLFTEEENEQMLQDEADAEAEETE